MIKYAPELRNIFSEEKINCKNIINIFSDRQLIVTVYPVSNYGKQVVINNLISRYQLEFENENCTIFDLPSGRRDNKSKIYLINYSKEEIIRALKLKAFW